MTDIKEDTATYAESERREATTCMALGAGVGALGAASAAITGVVCPLCWIVAPGLLGFGAFKRWRSEGCGQPTPAAKQPVEDEK